MTTEAEVNDFSKLELVISGNIFKRFPALMVEDLLFVVHCNKDVDGVKFMFRVFIQFK